MREYVRSDQGGGLFRLNIGLSTVYVFHLNLW